MEMYIHVHEFRVCWYHVTLCIDGVISSPSFRVSPSLLSLHIHCCVCVYFLSSNTCIYTSVTIIFPSSPPLLSTQLLSTSHHQVTTHNFRGNLVSAVSYIECVLYPTSIFGTTFFQPPNIGSCICVCVCMCVQVWGI